MESEERTLKCQSFGRAVIHIFREDISQSNMSVFALWPVVFYKNVFVFSNKSYISKEYLSYLYGNTLILALNTLYSIFGLKPVSKRIM